MFALRYFDDSGFLEVVESHLGEFYFRGSKLPESKTRLNGSQPPPGN